MAAQGLGELAQTFGPRATRWAIVIVVLAVCLSIGLQLHFFLRSLASDRADAGQSTVEVTRRPPPPRTAGREIASWNLFGAAEVEPVEGGNMDNLPITNLRLVLRGTFAAENDQNSSAIVEGPDDRVEFYAVGDRMPAGVTLHAVYRDRVVLSRGGRLETLFFPDANRELNMGSGSSGGGTSAAARVEQRKREIMQQQLEQIREKLKLRQQEQAKEAEQAQQ